MGQSSENRSCESKRQGRSRIERRSMGGGEGKRKAMEEVIFGEKKGWEEAEN